MTFKAIRNSEKLQAMNRTSLINWIDYSFHKPERGLQGQLLICLKAARPLFIEQVAQASSPICCLKVKPALFSLRKADKIPNNFGQSLLRQKGEYEIG